MSDETITVSIARRSGPLGTEDPTHMYDVSFTAQNASVAAVHLSDMSQPKAETLKDLLTVSIRTELQTYYGAVNDNSVSSTDTTGKDRLSTCTHKEQTAVALYNGLTSYSTKAMGNSRAVSPYAVIHATPGFTLRWEARIEFRGWEFHLGVYRTHALAQLAFEAALAAIVSSILNRQVRAADCRSHICGRQRILSSSCPAAKLLQRPLAAAGGLFGRRVRWQSALPNNVPKPREASRTGRSIRSSIGPIAAPKEEKHGCQHEALTYGTDAVPVSEQNKKLKHRSCAHLTPIRTRDSAGKSAAHDCTNGHGDVSSVDTPGTGAISNTSANEASTNSVLDFLRLPDESGVHCISGGVGRTSFYRTVIKHGEQLYDLGLYAYEHHAQRALKVAEDMFQTGKTIEDVQSAIEPVQQQDERDAEAEYA